MLVLKSKILEYSKISEEEFRYAAQFCKTERFEKGDFLTKTGQVVNKLYYMHKGCILIGTTQTGEEKIIEFFLDGDIFTDFHSYLHETPAYSYMRVLENSVIISIQKSDFEKVLKQSHNFERFGRKFLEERLLAGLINFQNNAMLSNEERYLRLMRKRPDLIQRVPQYLIALYLGLTPVGLSKIRKRLSAK